MHKDHNSLTPNFELLPFVICILDFVFIIFGMLIFILAFLALLIIFFSYYL